MVRGGGAAKRSIDRGYSLVKTDADVEPASNKPSGLEQVFIPIRRRCLWGHVGVRREPAAFVDSCQFLHHLQSR